mmetsp:Transcript_54787/g.87538  ORF Transcript_54787/g.87538 Transcript_54787/m.87538 type:complete len:538 (-) Transcript_54787:160-1773(-)
MAQCAVKSAIVGILSYELGGIDEIEITVDTSAATTDAPTTTTSGPTQAAQTQSQHHQQQQQQQEEERMRIARLTYERQLSREIDDNYIRKTRKEILTATLFSLYPDLEIPVEIVQLMLDYEQNDSLNEIFKLFGKLKTATICNWYPLPWSIGCVQMLIFAYLASQIWMNIAIQSMEQHHFILQILGGILTAVSLCQLVGCGLCLKLNLKPVYIQKLVNLKYVFFINHLTHYYDTLHYMKSHQLDYHHQHQQQQAHVQHGQAHAQHAQSKAVYAWELYVPFQKWCGALRMQNIYNVRNPQSKPLHILSFYLIKPIFCLNLGIQLVTLSPHCLSMWLLFYLYFTVLVSINVFNKSPIGSLIGCTILILIISATSIPFYPSSFTQALAISFDIFIFIIFLLYLFSLYLICCSGRVSTNRASGNIIIAWILLFTCYCLWVSELLYTDYAVNLVLVCSIYLLYIAFQMLLLTSSDLQSVGINCYFQIKFMFVAILFGWLCDLDTLAHVCCRHDAVPLEHASQHKASLDRDDDEQERDGAQVV